MIIFSHTANAALSQSQGHCFVRKALSCNEMQQRDRKWRTLEMKRKIYCTHHDIFWRTGNKTTPILHAAPPPPQHTHKPRDNTDHGPQMLSLLP